MKHHTLCKSLLLVLAFLVTVSSHAYASEVTGTLSSSNTNTAGGGGSEVGGTLGDGTITGTVTSGTASSSSGRRTTGGGNAAPNNGTPTILGASTDVASPPASQVANNFSSDGTALQTGGSDLAFDFGTPVFAEESGSILGTSTSAQAFGGVDGVSSFNWFWIILLLLLLLVIMIYIYSRRENRTRVQ